MQEKDPLKQLQQTLAALDRISAESSGLLALMDRIVGEVMQLSGAGGAVVERIEGEELVYVCAAGSVAAHVGLRLPARSSLSGLCLQTRSVQRCVDSEHDPRVDLDACRKVRARSMLIVPLVYGEVPSGVLKVVSERPDAFDDGDEQLLRLCAGVIGAALGRELALEAECRDRQRFALEAHTDPLTGLPNRRAFDLALRDLLDAPDPAARQGAGLCFIDLDGFKQLNDEHGHVAGDQALRHLADLLRAAAGADDLVARLAGDEFVALLRCAAGCIDDRCLRFARTLIAGVAASPLRVAGRPLPLSVSIGLAPIREGEAAGDWLSRADAAMYAAKREGPNGFALARDIEATKISSRARGS